jgi:hypothetical protein
MPFMLVVQFSGLCMHVLQKGDTLDTVLMPDARKRDHEPASHYDHDELVFHVPYLRADLANIDPKVPPSRILLDSDDWRPDHEVILRFQGEELDFGIPASGTRISLGGRILDESGNEVFSIVEISKIAKDLRPYAELLQGTPQEGSVVMRTTISGGTLRSVGGDRTWEVGAFPHDSRGEKDEGVFAGAATWVLRDLPDTLLTDGALVVTLTRFDGSGRRELRLVPRPTCVRFPGEGEDRSEHAIGLRLSNLCANNPLEWPELPINGVSGVDRDFKWYYRLLEAPGGMTPAENYAALLKGGFLPAPIATGVEPHGREDCIKSFYRVVE